MVMTTGCDGDPCCIKGKVEGWVYVLPDGTSPIISGSRVAPDGYVPAEDMHVYIEEYPDRETTTDANGYYFIPGIPPGTRTIVTVVDDIEVRFRVPVIACTTTIGGGHEQGGGGF